MFNLPFSFFFHFQINATDDDEEHSGNSNITYSIHSSWNSGIASQFPLILDEISGDVVLIWPVLPSHEYSMIVEACDNPAVQTDRLGFYYVWADPEGGQGVWTHMKNHKNIEFLSNTGPDPLENHYAIKPAFKVSLGRG